MLPLVILLTACASSDSIPLEDIQRTSDRIVYEVVLEEDPALLRVEVQGSRPLPRTWSFAHGPYVEDVRAGGQDIELDQSDLLQLPPGTTRFSYVYPLDRVASRLGTRFATGCGAGDGWLLAGGAYLPRPRPLPDHSIIIRFHDQKQRPLDVLTPQRPERPGVVRVRPSQLRNLGYHTFGGWRRTLKIDGGEVQVSILAGPGRLALERAELLGWVEQSARELGLVRAGGSFPHDRIPVTLIPVPGDETVPFGRVLWSEPQSVALFVGSRATRRDFLRDWVALHELLHLVHPNFTPRVDWLSEGVATYYQGVARMRSGRRTPQDMWSAVWRGTRMGRAEADGRSLPDVSRSMHRLHAYQTVYWGGALLLLDLDLELRKQTDNARSLDHVLKALMDDDGTPSLEVFGSTVDRVAGRALWNRLRDRHLKGPALSQRDRVFEALGIKGNPGSLTFDEGPKAKWRKAIEQGP